MMNTSSKYPIKKIAVCNFHNRVAPRFDLTPEILIFDATHSKKEPIEILDVSQMPSEKIVNMLVDRKVAVIISGGIQEKFQKAFLSSNIEVIWGVVGEIHDVFQAYMKGALHPGFGFIKGQGDRR